MTTPESGRDPRAARPDPHAVPPPPPVDAVTTPEHRALADARNTVSGIEHTASRATYVGWIVGVIVTILLLVFILRNQDSQKIDLVFGQINLPVGVSLLIAAIAGAIITLAITSARIMQLRRALRQIDKTGRSAVKRRKKKG